MHTKIFIFLPAMYFLSIYLFAPLSIAQDIVQSKEPTATVVEEDIQKKSFESVEERRLYAVLQNERASLEEEKKVIALKKKELKTLQEETDKKLELLDAKLVELQKTQANIEKLLAEKDVREVKKIESLSLIYAKMTPDRAALAMTGLDEQLAANLLAAMKVKSAARILDRMDKLKASRLSTTFATIKVEN